MQVNSITALEAFEILTLDQNSLLVDVRCDIEWQNTGKPKPPRSDQLLLNSIKLAPLMHINQSFIETLLEKASSKSKKIFLCRYGIRSLNCSNLALQNGLDNCYNIIDGFDGNEFGPGWKLSKLPIEF